MQIDTIVPALSPDTVSVAERAEELGFSGVWTMENSNDGLLPLPLVAEHSEALTMGTRIALSFTRSPMVIAQMAWDLANYSNGRFVLGLGTQVKGHNERRFSVEWNAPGPRLREVIESIHYIWDVFQHDEDLDYRGEHYSFSLMTNRFNPGPIDHPNVPIFIGGLNSYNLRLAGELCDGLAMHPFNSRSYLKHVIHNRLAEGAKRADRSVDEVTVLASPLVITGRTAEEMTEARERVRRRIAFYGSTRTYHSVLDHHGWTDIGEELYELSTQKRWDEMTDLVPDEWLEAFALEARPENLCREAEKIYDGVADRVVLPFDFSDEYMNR